ncbi:MAG: hypothetical protein IT516_02845 [Burkholderiales bacterium]|nr:hypothetical protein [Burkholderiales bacterium]
MRRLGFGVLGGSIGFVVAAIAGYVLVGALSSNTHDVAIEASMTAAFVAGPIGALLGLVVGIVLGGRKPPA